jgi:hypothetical protein
MWTSFIRPNDYHRKEAALGKGVSIDESGGRVIVNRRSGTNSCQCGSRLRGPSRHAAFFAPKDEQLVGHGAGLRVAELSRLEFIFINLSADLAEPSYCLTALRAGERYFNRV